MAEFEALTLGLREALQLGCHHLQTFGDSELVINMIKGKYRPAKKIFRRYIDTINQSIEHFLSFNLTHIRRKLNAVADKLAVFASSPSRQLLREQPSIEVISLYRPFVQDNERSWQIFNDDEDIDCFLAENIEDESSPPEIINLKNNAYPKGLIPLEDMFRQDDVPKNPSPDPKPPRFKMGPTLPINIGTEAEPKTLYITTQCTDEEKEKFTALFHEFIDVFAWSYKDLHGFDLGVIQHSIPLEEGVVPVRQRQHQVNPKLDALIRKELDKMLAANIIFPVRYSKWVTNLVPFRKKNGDIRLCVDFRDLNRVSVKDNFPLPFMDTILQQVAGSEMMSLLDGFSRYNQVFINP